MPKIINNSQILGHRGENLIKDLALDMGIAYERVSIDAGIDGTLELRDPNTGEMKNLLIRAQVKSTDTLQSESETEFSYTCTAEDLEYWLRGNVPNILIVCLPAQRTAYWKCLRTYFSDPTRRVTRTVRFQKAKDQFDRSAVDQLFQLARPVDSGLFMSPPRQSETLTSNLLEVKTPPTKIFIAPSTFTSTGQIYASASASGISLPPEVMCYGKMLISVHDFRSDKLFKDLCDSASTEEYSFDGYFKRSDPVLFGQAVELLGRCLQGFAQSVGLTYRHRDRLFYATYHKEADQKGRFPAQKRAFKSSGGDSIRLRGMVSPLDRKGAGKIKGLKHHAFFGDFRNYDGAWLYEISPTYHYTLDGYRKKGRSQELLSMIKRMERNKAVFSNLRLWEEFLVDSDETTLLHQSYPHLKFGPLRFFDLPIGIPDEAWNRGADTAAVEAEDEAALLALFK